MQDISATSDAGDDIYPGDIRNAKVRFLNGGAVITGTGTDANGWITPTLINNSDLKTGVIVLTWTVNIGAETDAEYTISTEVTGYYNRNDANDNTVVTVYKPTGDFITGGGFIVNPDNTAGTYAGDPGRRTNFGFNVKYNKKWQEPEREHEHYLQKNYQWHDTYFPDQVQFNDFPGGKHQ